MHTQTFTAIDFETAQYSRASICQVGLVRIEQGQCVQELSFLVRPPDNYYLKRFSAIHGLSWSDTCDAPNFASLWPHIEPYIRGQKIVAHNCAFDISCLRQTLDYYAIVHPEFEQACTYKIFRKSLAVLCSELDIALNHHDALSDAKACAELYLQHISRTAG